MHFVWLLPFDLSGIGDPPASIALRVIGTRKPPLHDKAVVLEETVYFEKLNICN
jgi:hypothetical protein